MIFFVVPAAKYVGFSTNTVNDLQNVMILQAVLDQTQNVFSKLKNLFK